jgi:hypothetical protein
MDPLQLNVTGSTDLTYGRIREQLARMAVSRTFARAHYLRRFLICAVEEALRGNSGQLKELWLGGNVFDRDESFDPCVDPIVRVQARRLRQKLTEYYRTEGASDPVRITIPTGSYVPVFSTSGYPEPPGTEGGEIAVLPLTPAGANPHCAHFAGIMTVELAEALGGTPKANFFVGGSVELEESCCRIHLQLTEARTGRQCWSAWFAHRNTRVQPDGRHLAALLRNEITTRSAGYSTSANPRFM